MKNHLVRCGISTRAASVDTKLSIVNIVFKRYYINMRKDLKMYSLGIAKLVLNSAVA
jgi:hypothetical protein